MTSMRRTSAVSLSLVLALVMFGTGPTATVASAQQDCALGERIASDGFTSTSIIDPTSNRWEDEWEMEPEFSDQIGATDVRLNRLTSSNSSGHIYERLLVNPGQSTSLRVNLTTGYRYTFCVTLHGYNTTSEQLEGASPPMDVYLMLDAERTNYENSAYFYTDSFIEEDELPEVPIEFRRFDTWLTWDTYRDVNAFESVTGPTTTTVTLDREEIWRQWGQVSHQNFNLVIDGRDNDRAFDAPASEVTVLAEVVILVEERPFTLPTWTVSLTCCGVMIGIVLVPALVNRRYGQIGRPDGASLVLSLDQHRRDRLMEDGVISPDEIDAIEQE